MQDSPLFYTKKGLKQRGWTDQLIDQYLGLPDRTKINMYHKSGPPVYFYESTRVHSIESQQEFIDIQQKRQKRREGARKGAATKREKMRQWLDEIEIDIPKMDWDILTREAIDSYNTLHYGNMDKPLATLDSNEEFLDRIRVNFLRHQLTRYETLLERTFGKVGAAKAYFEIKEKILYAIEETYPELGLECGRQNK